MVKSLVAFLLLLLLPGGVRSGSKNKNKDEGIPKVKRIECPAEPTLLENSVMGMDLNGHLRKKGDHDALAHLLLTTFRRETALQCDPYHRVLLQADFTPYPLHGDDPALQLPFYHVQVLSHGTSPCQTALEPEPPEYVATDKHPTGDVCKVPQILRELRGYYNKYDDPCPLLDCYCPNELIGEETTTTGVTESQLTDSLNDKLDRQRSGSKSNSKVLPKVESIQAVYELRPAVPPAECAAMVQPFDAVLLTYLSVHPCDLDPATLQAFVQELVKDYNWAQIHACDAGFRRIHTLDFTLPECPAGGYRHRRRRQVQEEQRGLQGWSLGSFPPLGLPFGAGSSTELTATSHGAGRRHQRRRHLEKRRGRTAKGDDERLVSLPSASAASSPWTNRSLARRRKRKGSNKGKGSGGELCLCSAFVKEPTSGITPDEFTALADDAMQRVTGGQVRVLEQLETKNGGGCPCLERFAFETHLAVAINVKVKSLTAEDLAELQNDCRFAYNNIVTEKCSQDYFIVQECKVAPLEHHYYHYLYEEEDAPPNSGASATFTQEESHDLKYMLSFFLKGTTCAQDDMVSPFQDDHYYRRGTRRLGARHNGTTTTTRGVVHPWRNAPELPTAPNATATQRARRDLVVHHQDTCHCPVGVAPGGDKPTLEQYVDALNKFGLGIVESALDYYS